MSIRDLPDTTLVKGTGLNSAMIFAENELGQSVVGRALKDLEPTHGEYQHHRLPGALNPLPTAAAAWVAVSDLHGGSIAERRVFFQKMGVYIADTNLHGIYKTLLSLIVNPQRLAKRVPQLWSTYFRGLTVRMDFDDVRSGKLRFDVDGFGGAPHIGEMAEGWLAFAFGLVGGEEVVATEEALEAGRPHPGTTMRYHVSWRV
ncbi:MAG: hypothetical protein AAF799_46195 [Myxococcota bacterium]